MDLVELKNARLKAFNDALSFVEHPKKTPHVSFFVTWKILDYGCRLSEALMDYDLMKKVVKTFQEKYNFDGMVEYGNRNQFRVSEHMGGSLYKVDDEQEALNYIDMAVCEADELAEYAADPDKFTWEKIVSRKYPYWKEEGVTVDFMNKLNEEVMGFLNFNSQIMDEMELEYGVPKLWEFRGGMTTLGPEFVFQGLRGIKGFSLDMRRNKSALHDAIQAYEALSLDPVLSAMDAAEKGHSKTAVFDGDLTMLAHTVMNPKQFDEFYWPSLKKELDIVQSHNWTIRIFTEGYGQIAWDHFNEYRKGTICDHVEHDDVYDLRKNCPGVVVMGGMHSHLLGNGTAEECVNEARSLLDTIGDEGGFILTQNMLGSYRNDGKAENIKAVCDFVNSYER
mgnify:CR=1 FL=1